MQQGETTNIIQLYMDTGRSPNALFELQVYLPSSAATDPPNRHIRVIKAK